MHWGDAPAQAGSCPISGVALKPVDGTGDAGPNAERVDMTRRFWVGLGLAPFPCSCAR